MSRHQCMATLLARKLLGRERELWDAIRALPEHHQPRRGMSLAEAVRWWAAIIDAQAEEIARLRGETAAWPQKVGEAPRGKEGAR